MKFPPISTHTHCLLILQKHIFVTSCFGFGVDAFTFELPSVELDTEHSHLQVFMF